MMENKPREPWLDTGMAGSHCKNYSPVWEHMEVFPQECPASTPRLKMPVVSALVKKPFISPESGTKIPGSLFNSQRFENLGVARGRSLTGWGLRCLGRIAGDGDFDWQPIGLRLPTLPLVAGLGLEF